MSTSKKALIAFILSLIIGAALGLMFNNNSNKGSTYEKWTTLFKTTKNNTSTYNVEAAGWNVRVIEWTPEDNKDYRCMFVAGTEKAGVGCYPANKAINNGE